MSNPNYAPNPKKQQVYRNLQNKKLSDVTAKDIQQLTDPTFIQATNQDALITYNMLNKAAMRDGLPIPGTNEIIESAVASDAGYTTIHTPKLGEVWQFISGCANTTTNPTGNITTELDIYDSINNRRMLFLDMSSSTSSDYPLAEVGFSPIVYAYPNVLRQRVEGTFDLATRTYSIIRIR
tara:strand:- start:2439 stop:2978 length:540 start_codon:yes stop_codon:yes gene_type:complete